ncbi:hypothetical protein MASR1M45_09900 [Candidatus Kapaibacterium sp.]
MLVKAAEPGVVLPIFPGLAHADAESPFDKRETGTAEIGTLGSVVALIVTSRYGFVPENALETNTSSLPEPVPSITEYIPASTLTVLEADGLDAGHSFVLLEGPSYIAKLIATLFKFTGNPLLSNSLP